MALSSVRGPSFSSFLDAIVTALDGHCLDGYATVEVVGAHAAPSGLYLQITVGAMGELVLHFEPGATADDAVRMLTASLTSGSAWPHVLRVHRVPDAGRILRPIFPSR